MTTPPVGAPRAVDPAEVQPETCHGCGVPYLRQIPQQSRCGKCIGTLLSSLGELTTGTAVAVLAQASPASELRHAVTLDHVVKTLEELLALDGRAISEIIRHRVRVNAGIVNHSSAKTKPESDADGRNTEYYMGVLGILNAIFGSFDGVGAICLRENEGGAGQILGFLRADEVINDPGVEQ